MANEISKLESATKYLSPEDKDRFFKLKRELEKSGTSPKIMEERLRTFLWEVVDADDDEDDEDDEDAH